MCINIKSQNQELSKFNSKIFCSLLVDYIKERIGINSNDFDKYIDYLAEISIDKEKIIKKILTEEMFNVFFSKSKIRNNKPNKLKARRCMVVITLALLKCLNYICLRETLQQLTGLSKRYIYDVIKLYIPVLNQLNPNIEVSRWLPQQSFEYNLFIVKKMIKERDWEVLSPKTQEEFKALRKKHICEPARIPLFIECDRGHKFYTNAFNLQRRESGCRKCADENKIKYNIDVIKRLVIKKGWVLKYPKNKKQFDILIKKLNCAPNTVPLNIECKIGHSILTNAHRLQQKLQKSTEGCLKCSHIKKVKYTIDFVSNIIRRNRGVLIEPKTQEQFYLLKKTFNCKPFKIPLKIKCFREHLFSSNASLIQQMHWCPYCKKIKSAIGMISHLIFEYLTIKYLLLRNCQADNEHSVNPNSKHQVDLLIKRNKDFITNIEANQNKISFKENIKEIAIDFTWSITDKFIIKKFYKNYQNKNRSLIVV